MYHHAAAAVSSHIWFSYNSYLYDLNTEISHFKRYRLPFHVSNAHCAVGNSTHSYVIGVGSAYDEVWVNKIPQNPSHWIRVAKLAFGRREIACLLHDDNIYVSGGKVASTSYRGVEVIDTKTYRVWKTGDMNTGRLFHRMMVLDGSPAVIAGKAINSIGRTSSLSDIEFHNTTSKTWYVSNRLLQQKRHSFGIAQL